MINQMMGMTLIWVIYIFLTVKKVVNLDWENFQVYTLLRVKKHSFLKSEKGKIDKEENGEEEER